VLILPAFHFVVVGNPLDAMACIETWGGRPKLSLCVNYLRLRRWYGQRNRASGCKRYAGQSIFSHDRTTPLQDGHERKQVSIEYSSCENIFRNIAVCFNLRLSRYDLSDIPRIARLLRAMLHPIEARCNENRLMVECARAKSPD
jgi:hypothetical protein